MSGSKDDDASSTSSGASQPGEAGTPASALSSPLHAAVFPGNVTLDSPPSPSDSDALIPHCSECGVELGIDVISCAVCGLILCDQHLPLGQHHDNRPDRMTAEGAPL